MQIATGIVLLVVYWWLAFFICLPWGLHVPKSIEKGFASSAPTNPQLRKKAWIATFISLIMLAITYWGLRERWVILDFDI